MVAILRWIKRFSAWKEAGPRPRQAEVGVGQGGVVPIRVSFFRNTRAIFGMFEGVLDEYFEVTGEEALHEEE